MACRIGKRLWNEYDKALAVFSERVQSLKDAPHSQDFYTIMAQCQEANKQCRAARKAAEDHQREHGCQGASVRTGK